MGESMFGKKERLYADTRIQEKVDPPQPEPRKAPEPRKEPAPAPRPKILDEQPKPQRKHNFRGPVSTTLELAGVTSLSVGGFLVAPWLGCMMLGVLLIVLGVAAGFGG